MTPKRRRAWERTLAEMLREEAESSPSETIYVFLEDGESASEAWTYADIDREARRVAAGLEDAGAAGSRVLILMPPGLDYAAALHGCFYAGSVPVPIYPPDPSRLDKTLPRLLAVAEDSEVEHAIAPSWLEPLVERIRPTLGSAAWTYPDQIPDGAGDDWSIPRVSPRELALIQYTSGSTGRPRGVMLTHENLLYNASVIREVAGVESGMAGVSWLPPYHDMGLIGGIIGPPIWHLKAVLMSPIAFLQRPTRWLQALSAFRAHLTGAPNFAFDLCVRKVSDEEKQKLDLGEWRAVFSGAEPIRAGTLERFTSTFAPCGFRVDAFRLAYGLAEATLLVSAGRYGPATPYAETDGERVFPASGGKRRSGAADRRLVSCGTPMGDFRVEIVDPASQRVCPAGAIGEIWVAGRSVAKGYWGNEEASCETFEAKLPEDPNTDYLRTGDLGALLDGELFIAGRQKDLLVIRGQNYYPQDIEATIERLGSPVRPGGGAAVGVEFAEQERLVLVQEVATDEGLDTDELMERIRATVRDEHSLNPDAVVLIRPRTLPKTSSGKVQRHACAAGWLQESLDAVAEWRSPVWASAGLPKTPLQG